MTKKLTFTIQCGENTCEDGIGNCKHLSSYLGRFCFLFSQTLKSDDNDVRRTLRCKQCKEASGD
jgi:hypothetical protein